MDARVYHIGGNRALDSRRLCRGTPCEGAVSTSQSFGEACEQCRCTQRNLENPRHLCPADKQRWPAGLSSGDTCRASGAYFGQPRAITSGAAPVAVRFKEEHGLLSRMNERPAGRQPWCSREVARRAHAADHRQFAEPLVKIAERPCSTGAGQLAAAGVEMAVVNVHYPRPDRHLCRLRNAEGRHSRRACRPAGSPRRVASSRR